MFCFWNEIEMYLEGNAWYIKNSQMADNFDFSSFMPRGKNGKMLFLMSLTLAVENTMWLL